MATAPSTSVFIGATADGKPQALELKRANRHGLIAGATGTGKTVTLQGIVEGMSAAGVPCFVADVKGDLSGLAMASMQSVGSIQRSLLQLRSQDGDHFFGEPAVAHRISWLPMRPREARRSSVKRCALRARRRNLRWPTK